VSRKNHRSGGKFGGTHTTIIPAAGIVADIASLQADVQKVILGFIKTGLPSANGQRRVKFTEEKGSLLLAVRDNASHQELRVYTADVPKTQLAIAREARDHGLHVSFTKDK